MAKKKDNTWAIIAAIIVIIAVIIVAIKVFPEEEPEPNITTVDLVVEEEEPFDPTTYWKKLTDDCRDQEYKFVGCCLVSASIMKGREYKLVDDEGECPEGLEAKKLECPGSYNWCAPAKPKTRVIGNVTPVNETEVMENETVSDGGNVSIELNVSESVDPNMTNDSV